MYPLINCKHTPRLLITGGVLFFLLLSLRLFAQGENNNWCFGRFNFGLTFNTTPPTWFTMDTMGVAYGSSSVSDASGNLLFYSNGAMVWNRNHQLMPDGAGLSGYPSPYSSGFINSGGSRCGVLIIKSVSNPNQYYLITTDAIGNNTRNLYYSLIDISLDNGLGDIVPGQKNIVLATDVSEGVIATQADGICAGYWIVCHKRVDAEYLAIKLDINGFATSPVISTGSYINNPGDGDPLCFNPAGDRLVRCAKSYTVPFKGIIETASFNNATGQLSNFLTIQNADSVTWRYPIFSPDGSRLYCGANGYNIGFGYYQFNMALLPNALAVANSKTLIDSTADFWGARIGPDGKLYISVFFNQVISIINYPNNPPATCGFVFQGILIPTYATSGGHSYNYALELGSPALTLSSANTVVHQVKDTSICPGLGQSLTFSADTMYQSQIWSTGSTNVQETFAQPGTYWLRGLINCTTYIDTFHVHPFADTIIHAAKDTTICFGQTLSLSASPDYQSPIWSTGSTSSQETFVQPGTYWLYGLINCTTHIDTFHIQYPDFEIQLGHDTSICTGKPLQLDATIPGAASYLWQNRSTNATYTVHDEGIYSVAVTKDGCMLSDTISVGIIYPELNIQEHDTTICAGESIQLHAAAAPESTLYWNTGTIGPATETKGGGTYAVAAMNVCGTFHDSVNIEEKDCPCIVFVPTAFSPNGDGSNDVFDARLRCPFLTGYGLTVFNRYGQKIFESLQPGQGWDGWYNGKPADPGTYFYYLQYYDGHDETRKKGISF